jgi:hypothetical protein
MTFTKTAKMLPKTTSEILNGGIYNQPRKCGKQNCKCARGEYHSAYYFFTRYGGTLYKTYIKKSELEAFSRIAQRASLERYARRQANKSSNEIIRSLRRLLREKQALINL